MTGVDGLLKRLAAVSRTASLLEYAGGTAGVCGHSCLHAFCAKNADRVLDDRNFDSVVTGRFGAACGSRTSSS